MTALDVYLDNGGRCTCTRHAGAELAASIAANPDARYHVTPLGDWERITDQDVRAAMELDDATDVTDFYPTCEECEREARAARQAVA